MHSLLPPHARVWVYQSTRPFTENESASIAEKVNLFVQQWTSHKAGVIGDGLLLYNRFVVLMADEEQVGVSGCSVDSSVRFIKSLEQELNTNFFDRWNIAYFKNNEVHNCGMADFEKLIESGEVNDETIVFNNLVQNKKDFEANWKVPYAKSWLKNFAKSNTRFSSVL